MNIQILELRNAITPRKQSGFSKNVESNFSSLI